MTDRELLDMLLKQIKVAESEWMYNADYMDAYGELDSIIYVAKQIREKLNDTTIK